MSIVTFIGLDGSGKTTQATRFVERRRVEGIDVVYEHQFRFNSNRVMRVKASLRPFLRRAQGTVCEYGTVLHATHVRKTSERGGLWKLFRKALLRPLSIAALLLLGWYRTWNKIRRNRQRALLALDRYFYDELIRVEFQMGIQLPFRFLWLRLLPRPDLIIYFDIPAQVAWERSDPKDSTVDAMAQKARLYKSWLPIIAQETALHEIPIFGLTADEVQQRVEVVFHESREESGK